LSHASTENSEGILLMISHTWDIVNIVFWKATQQGFKFIYYM